MAQALVRFLSAQRTERDGVEHRFIEGCFGIFGHGNLTGVGQALAQDPDLLTYYQARNEQAMVHTAAGFARMRNRLGTLACTTSIGPGATNMVTGAAAATVNRVPVLLLPGDVFASRRPDPVLQQLESPSRGDVSVNDSLIAVSRYFDRIQRPEQLIPAALSAMRVLTSQADTGAATLALPQDVQTEAYDYPDAFFEKRIWHLSRPLPDASILDRAAGLIRSSKQPLIIAGGGVIYSEATEVLRKLVRRTGIPVVETQAGKGSLPFDHPGALGAIGATGTPAANRIAAEADLVLGVGTRYSDSTMGYEIAGGLGVKLADPSREVYVMVGDGSYLMMSQEIVTSIQERAKLTIVLVDNEGFASIGGLSRSKGMAGFGTRYRYRSDGSLGDDEKHDDAERLPVDLARNAEGLGAHVFRTHNVEELRDAINAAKNVDRPVVIYIPTDRYESVPSYDSWWEVPVAEVADSKEVQKAREEHERGLTRRRWNV